MKMEFFEVIKKRRSIRKYLLKEISDEILKKIIEAANMAPSALNEQPWEFIIVRDKKLKKKTREIFNIPEKYEIVLLLALGYPDENPEPKPKKPAKEKIHYNRFGGK